MKLSSLKNVFKASSWKALIHDYIGWNSPLRVIRWYALRIFRPFSYLKRRRMVKTIAPENRQRVQDLINNGAGIAKPDVDPVLLSEVCTELRNRADEMKIDPNDPNTKGKNFWKHLIGDGELTTESPFVRLALQPNVLETASQYMGEVPYLAYIHVALSHPTSNDGWKASQLWHQDYDDRKMCKLFVYCTDVHDEDDGPFTYIPRHLSTKVPNKIFPDRITDETMKKHVRDEDVERLIGPAESAFYIDTRNCYHLGSRIKEGHRRIAFMASFVSSGSLQHFDNGIKITTDISDLERLVLTHP